MTYCALRAQLHGWKTLRTLIATLALFALLSPLMAGDMPGDFFPDGKFDYFKAHEWYGKYLASMQEPSLYKISKRNSSVQIYRITSFPSYDPCVALRLEVRRDGEGFLEVKKMEQVELSDGQGYAPGRLIRKVQIPVPASKVGHFLHLLKAIHFWTLPTHSPILGGDHLGGDSYLYEGTLNGTYHVLDVEDERRVDVFAPAQYLLDLAGEK